MATAQASSIRQPGGLIFGRVTLPKKTAAQAILKGSFLMLDVATGTVELLDSATKGHLFIGVSDTESLNAAGDQEILVYTEGIIEVSAESDAYIAQEALSMNVTNGTVQSAPATNNTTIGWCYKTTAASATKVLMVFDTKRTGASVWPITVTP
jgi:hypothetical protein